MKSLNEYINNDEHINESLFDMWNIAGAMIIYNTIMMIGALGVGIPVSFLLRYWIEGTVINAKQRRLITNVLSFAEGNKDCPKYNNFVKKIKNDSIDKFAADTQYSITGIIKELINVVETDEQKEGLIKLIELQCKQLRSFGNQYWGNDSFTKSLNDGLKQEADELYGLIDKLENK